MRGRMEEDENSIEQALFPEKKSESRQGLYSLSPEVRKQIKEALMKRFPVVSGKIASA